MYLFILSLSVIGCHVEQRWAPGSVKVDVYVWDVDGRPHPYARVSGCGYVDGQSERGPQREIRVPEELIPCTLTAEAWEFHEQAQVEVLGRGRVDMHIPAQVSREIESLIELHEYMVSSGQMSREDAERVLQPLRAQLATMQEQP